LFGHERRGDLRRVGWRRRGRDRRDLVEDTLNLLEEKPTDGFRLAREEFEDFRERLLHLIEGSYRPDGGEGLL